MENNNPKSDKEEVSSISLLQRIKSGEINPKVLSKEDRQTCVNVLALQEGFSVAHIAQVMKCCEKTIQRDLTELRRRNSLSPSLESAKGLIGELVVKAQTHAAHLMRLARSGEGSVGEKAQAEFLAWRVFKELADKLQSLGYLPLVTQHIQGEFIHRYDDADGEKDIAELRKALDAIEATAKETGTFDADTEEEIRQIKAKIEKAEIELKIDGLKNKQDKTEGGQNESNNQ